MSGHSMLAHSGGSATRTSDDGTPSADDHLAITDALLRFGAGTDTGDSGLLSSAFADEAVIDFAPCGRKLGLDFKPLRGRRAIVDFLAGTNASQVTSHVVTNARTRLVEGGASLCALVDATHVLRADTDRRFRMMNWYQAHLESYQDTWLLKELVINNIWSQGDSRTIVQR